MPAPQALQWRQPLGLTERRPPDVYSQRSQLTSARRPPAHAHILRRAWDVLGLDGIVCFGGQPAVYIKTVDDLTPSEVRELHLSLWNQGAAPILLIVSRLHVHVYSGLALPAQPDAKVDDQDRHVETLDIVKDALNVASLIGRMESGVYFQEHERSFDPRRRVDRCLLRNLEATRGRMTAPGRDRLKVTMADALLARTVLTCYLTDRKVLDGDYYEQATGKRVEQLVDLLKGDVKEARKRLYALFVRLQQDFNGDIFNADLPAERKRVAAKHIRALRDLLAGHDVPSGQLHLGFWAYDFGTIPVETISAMYDRFLEAESPEKKRASGAYYTPRVLTELTLDIAFDGERSLLNKRILDPACGSGIFLVTMFNRMAEEWKNRNESAYNLKRADALMKILRDSFFGIDTSETACRLTALSLYLAFLDQLKSPDILELKRKRPKFLPRLIWDPGQPNTGRNIMSSNFFAEELPLPGNGFDLVVGNPPWSTSQHEATDWCRKHGLPIPQNQSAYAFLWKAPTHLRAGGRVCLVLPVSVLVNHRSTALEGQRYFLEHFTVERVVNLADMSLFLFEGARRPSAIISYRDNPPDRASHRIRYVVPKAEYQTIRAELLTVSPDDEKQLRQSRVLDILKREAVPVLWKQAMWGGWRDRKFLDRLACYETLGQREVGQGGNWTFREGFNKGGKGKPLDREILHNIRFMPSEAMEPYVAVKERLEPRPDTFMPRYCPKDTEVFMRPHVLFPTGVSRKGERIKAGFADFDCSFKHDIRSIHGPDEDEMRFLSCVLASRLALYYFFHTTANWGIERAKIHVDEYRRMPFPRPDTASKRKLVKTLAKLHRQLVEYGALGQLCDQAELDKRTDALDELVYKYYEIDKWERALIGDTVAIWIPSATPTRRTKKIPASDTSSPANRREYRVQLLDAMNSFAGSDHPVACSVICSEAHQMAVGILERSSRRSKLDRGETVSSERMSEILRDIKPHLGRRTQTTLYQRDLKVFTKEYIYLVKPLARRYWCRTAALNDADEILGAVIK